MQPRTYFLISAIVFSLVATGHLLRIVNGWSSQIGVWPVPMSVSWGGVIIAGFLSVCAFRLFFRR
jgi:hypothetical protein